MQLSSGTEHWNIWLTEQMFGTCMLIMTWSKASVLTTRRSSHSLAAKVDISKVRRGFRSDPRLYMCALADSVCKADASVVCWLAYKQIHDGLPNTQGWSPLKIMLIGKHIARKWLPSNWGIQQFAWNSKRENMVWLSIEPHLSFLSVCFARFYNRVLLFSPLHNTLCLFLSAYWKGQFVPAVTNSEWETVSSSWLCSSSWWSWSLWTGSKSSLPERACSLFWKHRKCKLFSSEPLLSVSCAVLLLSVLRVGFHVSWQIHRIQPGQKRLLN